MFTHVCHFKIGAEGRDAEELELELIDFGAEEIGVDDDAIVIYGPFESYGGIQKKLEEEGIEIVESGFDRIPSTTKELGTDETIEVEKLIEKLEEDEDVQNVFHTMSSSSEE
jgi:transcriptional/translational regulatory protein YebC/TACO1